MVGVWLLAALGFPQDISEDPCLSAHNALRSSWPEVPPRIGKEWPAASQSA